MSKKFKVGDLVTGVADSKYLITDIDMIAGRVVKADGGRFMDIKILKHKNCAYVGDEFSVENTDKLFKLVNEVIVVYREGDTVIAHNKVTDKKGIVKCSPEDTFDFNIGAKLAFERLMGTDVKEVKRHAKVGEYIKIVYDGIWHADYYELGDILKVTDYHGDKEYGEVNTINLRTNKETCYVNPREYVVLEGYVPKEEPKEEPKEPPFKPGDLVVLTEAECDIPKGAKAYVVKVDYDGSYFLDFCVEYECTHKGARDYELKEPTGRWVHTSKFEKVNK